MTQQQRDASLLRVVADFFDAYDTEHSIDDDKSVQANLRDIASRIEASA